MILASMHLIFDMVLGIWLSFFTFVFTGCSWELHICFIISDIQSCIFKQSNFIVLLSPLQIGIHLEDELLNTVLHAFVFACL